MDQHSPLAIWRDIARKESRHYRQCGYSTASIKTGSAHRQFIIELHASWRVEFQAEDGSWQNMPTAHERYVTSYNRARRLNIALMRAHGFSQRTQKYSGYRAWLRTEARLLIYCEGCARGRRSSRDCQDCKNVRRQASKNVLCPDCFKHRGTKGACDKIGQCQTKAMRFLYRQHPPECLCPWKFL